MTKIYLPIFVIALWFSILALPPVVNGVEIKGGNTKVSFTVNNFAGCRVSTRSGNLNVRNNAGNVIAKLRNGLSVRVVTDDGDRFLIAAYVGRKTIRGWVSSEFVVCN